LADAPAANQVIRHMRLKLRENEADKAVFDKLRKTKDQQEDASITENNLATNAAGDTTRKLPTT
jgi:hypothetical protein